MTIIGMYSGVGKPSWASVRQVKARQGMQAVGCLVICASLMAGCAKPKPFPAGSTGSSKTASFGYISATSPDLRDVPDAHTRTVGKEGHLGKFKGTIVALYQSYPHTTVVLDFDKNYHATNLAVVQPWNLSKFPDLKTLRGKAVLVEGKWAKYKSHTLEIDLADPSQIKLVGP